MMSVVGSSELQVVVAGKFFIFRCVFSVNIPDRQTFRFHPWRPGPFQGHHHPVGVFLFPGDDL